MPARPAVDIRVNENRCSKQPAVISQAERQNGAVQAVRDRRILSGIANHEASSLKIAPNLLTNLHIFDNAEAVRECGRDPCSYDGNDNANHERSTNSR